MAGYSPWWTYFSEPIMVLWILSACVVNDAESADARTTHGHRRYDGCGVTIAVLEGQVHPARIFTSSNAHTP